MRKTAIIIFLLLLFPFSISADECSNADKERLQKLANNITYIIENYTNNNGEEKLRLVFSGVSNELTLYNSTNNKYYFYIKIDDSYFGDVDINNVSSGTKKFKIYGASSCSNTTLRNITINVSPRNPYFNDPLCDNIKEYSLCQKFTNANVDYETFKVKTQDYIDSKKKNENVPNDNNYDDSYWKFFEFYQKYYFVMVIITFGLFSLLLFLWIRQNRKRRL